MLWICKDCSTELAVGLNRCPNCNRNHIDKGDDQVAKVRLGHEYTAQKQRELQANKEAKAKAARERAERKAQEEAQAKEVEEQKAKDAEAAKRTDVAKTTPAKKAVSNQGGKK